MKSTVKFKEYLQENKPCWKGYKQVGLKKKDGKLVPNCIPEEIEEDFLPSGLELYEDWEELSEEVEKNGKKIYNSNTVLDIDYFVLIPRRK